jgi:hypothetical protein
MGYTASAISTMPLLHGLPSMQAYEMLPRKALMAILEVEEDPQELPQAMQALPVFPQSNLYEQPICFMKICLI